MAGRGFLNEFTPITSCWFFYLRHRFCSHQENKKPSKSVSEIKEPTRSNCKNSECSPSMMDMCTALRRVRGTLLRRGPWVMDGQLLLGTRPALQGQTQGAWDKHTSRHWGTATSREDSLRRGLGGKEFKPSASNNLTCVFLEVLVWFWHSAPSPLSPHVRCREEERRSKTLAWRLRC